MTSRRIDHSITFETEFVLENMEPRLAQLVDNMSEEDLRNLCNRALSEGIRDHLLDKINAEASWGILRLAGE